MKAARCKYQLDFRFLAITSREKLRSKDTYFIKVWEDDPLVYGIGEAALFRGLSSDDCPEYEDKLSEVCQNIDAYASDIECLSDYPSIRMGVETAILDLKNGGMHQIFPTEWSEAKSSITINGLVWMGDMNTMAERIKEKVDAGFHCVKLKIGGINFDDELRLLELVRKVSPGVEIRLDANGAFSPENAEARLSLLSAFNVHSIEQPIRQGQWDEMARLCRISPIPIALDEELIGINSLSRKIEMLNAIRPQYIILKPTLCGGFSGADEWITIAESMGIGWWATSALESNIGLNAIAQWVSSKNVVLPQGLGTGQLYHNNILSPLTLVGDRLYYRHDFKWEIPNLRWNQC